MTGGVGGPDATGVVKGTFAEAVVSDVRMH